MRRLDIDKGTGQAGQEVWMENNRTGKCSGK